MSEDLINTIPQEMLCTVFDLLGYQDRMVAMTTCSRWFNVLSSARYLRLLVLDISQCINGGQDIEKVKHYPNICIRSVCDSGIARSILLDGSVSGQLEELYLVGSSALDDVFIREGTVHLPKLRKLSIRSFTRNFQYNLKLVAPNLKCLEVVHDEYVRFYSDGLMVQQFIDQVEELIVEKGNSCLVNADRTYTNLRRLTLSCSDENLFKGEVFRKYASRLTHLQLSIVNQDWVTEISPEFDGENLFLQHFNITYSFDYRMLAGLDSLEQLSISEQDEDDQTPNNIKLFLPNLTKLKVNIIRTPRFVVENLRDLHVYFPKFSIPFAAEIQTFFQSVCQNLQVLAVDFASAESSFIVDQICNMKQLQSLSFTYSTFNRQDLMRMFSEVKHLRRARFVRCNVPSLAKEKQEQLFSELRAQLGDCTIIVQ